MQDTTIIFSMHDSICQHLSLPNTSCITVCQHPPESAMHDSPTCKTPLSSSACMIVSAKAFPFPTHPASTRQHIMHQRPPESAMHDSPTCKTSLIFSMHDCIRQHLSLPDASCITVCQHLPTDMSCITGHQRPPNVPWHHHSSVSARRVIGATRPTHHASPLAGAPSGMDGNGTVDLLG